MEKNDGKIFGFHRNIFFLGLVSLFTDISSEMIYPLLPVFLVSVLGVGPTFVGLVEGVAEATASFLKLFSGWFSDRRQKRKFLVVSGYTLSTLTRPLVAAATAGWHVLFIRFLDRVGKGIRTSPRDALAANLVQPHLRGTAYGLFHFSIGLSTLPASLLMGFLWETVSPKAAFGFGAVLALLAAGLLWLTIREQKYEAVE